MIKKEYLLMIPFGVDTVEVTFSMGDILPLLPSHVAVTALEKLIDEIKKDAFTADP